MNVAPGATFEAYSPELASGLVGTVGVRIRDGAGTDFLARTTASITEDVTVGATSVYRRSFTAPTIAGQYWLIWDDGTTVGVPVELLVTYSAPTANGSELYVTPDEMKSTLDVAGVSYDDDLTDTIAAVSRGIDMALGGRRFYQATETRYFTADRYDQEIHLGDVVSISSVTIDENGTGAYATTWVDGTDFYLDPPNALLDGKPYRRLARRSQAGRVFPTYARGIKVVGVFGYSDTPPPGVKEMTKILVAKLLVRKKQAPMGFQAIAGDVGAIARLARTDPDWDFLVGKLDPTPLLV